MGLALCFSLTNCGKSSKKPAAVDQVLESATVEAEKELRGAQEQLGAEITAYEAMDADFSARYKAELAKVDAAETKEAKTALLNDSVKKLVEEGKASYASARAALNDGVLAQLATASELLNKDIGEGEANAVQETLSKELAEAQKTAKAKVKAISAKITNLEKSFAKKSEEVAAIEEAPVAPAPAPAPAVEAPEAPAPAPAVEAPVAPAPAPAQE